MLKIWNCSSIWPNKVNFIDSNNVILGYDLEQSCCEHAFWYITTTLNERLDGGGDQPIRQGSNESSFEFELEDYVFDPTFFTKFSLDGESGHAIFKLVRQYSCNEVEPLYLHLENHQNGYYSHGFVFRADKSISGYL